jgi:hypothetical protein
MAIVQVEQKDKSGSIKPNCQPLSIDLPQKPIRIEWKCPPAAEVDETGIPDPSSAAAHPDRSVHYCSSSTFYARPRVALYPRVGYIALLLDDGPLSSCVECVHCTCRARIQVMVVPQCQEFAEVDDHIIRSMMRISPLKELNGTPSRHWTHRMKSRRVLGNSLCLAREVRC